ncbi:ATP-dependent DNA ligase [soil metagenome]
MPPVAPMLAKAIADLPEGAGWLFEPKWDGFRCLVFRDGDEIELASRNERPLTRYFPELHEPLRTALPQRCVLDGEIVIAGPDGLDFDALLQRIHPAASRIQKLAAETPASLVAFDLLAEGDDDLTATPFADRRRRLAAALDGARPPVHLTPLTDDRALAADWFDRFEGAGLDGVVAKEADRPYRPGERLMRKIKHARTADVVVAGYRTHKSGDGVGSLLLGLFDDDGTLHHVGVANSFTAKRRGELVDELAPYADGAIDGHPWQSWAEAAVEEAGAEAQRRPGAASRWNAGKDLSWSPIRAELVAEVAYDHLQGDPAGRSGHAGRFRHATRLVRWRPDREPASCTYAQLETSAPAELAEVFGQ